MEANNLENKVLEVIKESNIKPKARWHFLLKNYGIWAAGVAALLASGAAFSILVYFFSHNDFALREEINKSWLEMLVLTMPYLWLIFLSLFVFIVYFNLKHTKNGYRYPIWLIAIVAISASIFLGGTFSLAGWGEKMDEALEKDAPMYSEIMNPHLEFWSNPADGRLVGVISSSSDEKSLILIDKDERVWAVSVDEETFSAPLMLGQPVKMIGTQKEEKTFEATRIMPMTPGRGFFKRIGSEEKPLPGEGRGKMRAPQGNGANSRARNVIIEVNY